MIKKERRSTVFRRKSRAEKSVKMDVTKFASTFSNRDEMQKTEQNLNKKLILYDVSTTFVAWLGLLLISLEVEKKKKKFKQSLEPFFI